MISIREVAELAGVSPATVSRVMNGTAKVFPELTTICQPIKEMVEKAVELIVNNELTGMTGGKFVFPVSLVARQTTRKKES
jgi:DNA-binding LacI/PurR family transcriptional regulator